MPQGVRAAAMRFAHPIFMSFGALVILVMLGPRSVSAQAAQPFSLQGSALYTVQSFGSGQKVGGVGIEAQARYNPSRLSFGVGYQYTSHSSGGDDLKLSGVFFEPRFAIDVGSRIVFPYLAGRATFLHQTSDFANYGKFSTNGHAFGLGAGLLCSLTYRLNLDFGAAVVRQVIEEKTFAAGPPATFPAFTGFVVKGGVTIGLGGR